MVSLLGTPDIDIFASKDNYHCPRYVSWFRDPGAEAIDAFTLDWRKLNFYAFPPFALILRVLQKICSDGATGIIVIPLWEAQPWYPLFIKLIVGEPVHFKPAINLLISPYSENRHPLAEELTLVAAKLSGRPSKLRASQRKL